MDNGGWIKLYRSTLDSSIFDNPINLMVWIWCLIKASHAPQKFPFNGGDIELQPGQFITGRMRALKELPVTHASWRRSLRYLIGTNRLAIKSNNKFSIITVINWESYQNDNNLNDKQTTSKRQANDKQTATYKNDKNDKNDKKNTPPDLFPVLFDAFWDDFPARNGKKHGRPAAYRLWLKLTPADQELLLTAARNYATSALVTRGVGIPDPVRFIHSRDNGATWRQWLAPETPPPATGFDSWHPPSITNT